jgi:hypothetical protein
MPHPTIHHDEGWPSNAAAARDYSSTLADAREARAELEKPVRQHRGAAKHTARLPRASASRHRARMEADSLQRNQLERRLATWATCSANVTGAKVVAAV